MVTTTPGADLSLLLAHASHALATELTAGLAELGISPRAHCVLSKAMTGELTQKQLADLCGLDKTTMVVTLDELERAGLAERRPSSADRRAHIIAVTEAGEHVVVDPRDDLLGGAAAGARAARRRAARDAGAVPPPGAPAGAARALARVRTRSSR